MNEFWIPISYDDKTGEKLAKAVQACYRIHLMTLEELNSYFLFHAENYLLRDFRRELAIYLRENKDSLPAQHYSLTKAAEKTFPYFSQNKKINQDGKFNFVEPIPPQDYQDIQIETRIVWYKYLALNSLITTRYGTVYLDEEKWPEIAEDQAKSRNITFDNVPFLWHSVVIHVDPIEPKLKFNLHEPNSRFGKRSQREMKKYVR